MRGARGLALLLAASLLLGVAIAAPGFAGAGTASPPASPAGGEGPPQTTITSGPKGKTRKRRARFTFISSKPGQGGFQCQIDSHKFVLCSSPFVRRLGLGWHTFRVRAYDGQSRPDPTLAVRKFRILPKKAKKRR